MGADIKGTLRAVSEVSRALAQKSFPKGLTSHISLGERVVAQLRLRNRCAEADALDLFVQGMEAMRGHARLDDALAREKASVHRHASSGIIKNSAGDGVLMSTGRLMQGRDVSETMEMRRKALTRQLVQRWRQHGTKRVAMASASP